MDVSSGCFCGIVTSFCCCFKKVKLEYQSPLLIICLSYFSWLSCESVRMLMLLIVALLANCITGFLITYHHRSSSCSPSADGGPLSLRTNISSFRVSMVCTLLLICIVYWSLSSSILFTHAWSLVIYADDCNKLKYLGCWLHNIS